MEDQAQNISIKHFGNFVAITELTSICSHKVPHSTQTFQFIFILSSCTTNSYNKHENKIMHDNHLENELVIYSFLDCIEPLLEKPNMEDHKGLRSTEM